MRVSSGSSPWGSADDTARTRTADPREASLFLRAQSASLRWGLAQADHRPAVGVVLGAHDASHEAWLSLIGALQDAGQPSADAVAALYTYHGRVVGFLERGLDRQLDTPVRSGLRAHMTARLDRLTESAVAALLDHPQRDPALHR